MITSSNKIFNISGGRAQVTADITFDSSYPTGGTDIHPDRLFGMHKAEFALIEPAQGYSFQYDYTNNKIKAFAPAPPIVYEEKHTPSSDVITLNYPAAFIMSVCRSGNNKKLRSTGIAVASLSDDQCSLVALMAEGEATQITVKDYDRLASQGLFTSGATTGWTLDLAYWTTGSNKLAKDADSGTSGTLVQAWAPTVGRTYLLTYVISSWSVGDVTPTCGGVSMTAAGADGTFTAEFTALSTAALTFTASDTSRFTIDSITVYDLTEPVYVTYVTQAWRDVWDNLVQDEEITLATGVNTLGEIMPNVEDRDFSAASAWTNVDIASYDEETSGVLTLAPDGAGQYCYLPLASAPMVKGTAYRLTLDVTSLTDTWQIYDMNGYQLLGTITTTGTSQSFDFTATTEGGLRLVAVTATAAAVLDNFSISPGNKILACMYVDQTEATAVGLTMIDEDDTAATGEVAIKFNSARNHLTVASAQNGKDAKITYVKNPESGFLADRAFNDETATKRKGSAYVNFFSKPVLLWGYSGEVPVYGGTTQVMIDSASTPGAGECVMDWTKRPRNVPSPPPLVVEELVTVTSNLTAELDYLPLYIIAVEGLATATPVVCSVIPVGETVGANQVAVDFTTGGLTFKASDAITTAKITYIPKRDSGYLSSVTVDEAATASASKVNLAARAALIQYVWDNTDNNIMPLEQPGGAPSEHKVVIDINDSGNTSIDSHANDAANTLAVTYVPYAQIPPGCFIDDTDITLSSEVWNFTGDPGVLGYNNVVVPGYGPNVIGETGAAGLVAALWSGPTGADGDGVSTWFPATNSIVTNQSTACTILSMPWMVLDVAQLTPFATVFGQAVDVYSSVTCTGAGVWGSVNEIQNLQPLEVKNGTDLSGLSLKIFMIGV